jgi:3-phosphoshikimate 1-carboxyvinyltransferase
VENGVYETQISPPTGGLRPIQLDLPGDISAAAFLIAAAIITPGSEVALPEVGINSTRVGIIDALRAMGGHIEITHPREQAGEPVADLLVQSSALHGIEVSGPLVVRMIDEFSVFGAAAAFAAGETRVRDAAELRLKESDRIGTLCQELRKMGVTANEAADGFVIYGGMPAGGTVEAHGDHRLAMAMAVAGLAARAPVSVSGAEMMDESFPGFVNTLRSLGANCVEEMGQPA